MRRSTLKRRALLIRAHVRLNGGLYDPSTGIYVGDANEESLFRMLRRCNFKRTCDYDRLFQTTYSNRNELIRRKPRANGERRAFIEATYDYQMFRMNYFSDYSFNTYYWS